MSLERKIQGGEASLSDKGPYILQLRGKDDFGHQGFIDIEFYSCTDMGFRASSNTMTPVQRPAIRAGGPVGQQVERTESITGQGYIERVKQDGKVVQIKIFDAAGNLRETIDKGSFVSLE